MIIDDDSQAIYKL